MSNIRPDEVSSIIREQLSNFKSESELEEVGTILQVGDGVARIYGLSNAKAGELLEFGGGVKGLVLNLEEDNVGAVLMGDSSSIKEGDTVKRSGEIASIEVGEGSLVGAGAVVTKNVKPYSVVTGVPAKRIKSFDIKMSPTHLKTLKKL